MREEALAKSEKEFKELYLRCPNIILESVPEGNKEAESCCKTMGGKATFTFTPKNHVDLGAMHGWFDFEAAARMTGRNFALYKGDAVMLMYKLMLFMLNNNIKHGLSANITSLFS